MDDGWSIVGQAVLSLSALIGGTFVISAITSPRLFLILFGLDNSPTDREITTITKYAKYTFMWAVALSVGYFLWGGFSLVVEVIPADWGGLDEDGEWLSTRRWMQFFLVPLATLGIVTSAEPIAQKIVAIATAAKADKSPSVSETASKDAHDGRFQGDLNGHDLYGYGEYETAWIASAQALIRADWRNLRVERNLEKLEASRAESEARRKVANRDPEFIELDRDYYREYGGTNPDKAVRTYRGRVLPDDWQKFADTGYPADAYEIDAAHAKQSIVRLLDGHLIWSKFWQDGAPLFSTYFGDGVSSADLTPWLKTLPGVKPFQTPILAKKVGNEDVYKYKFTGLDALRYDKTPRGLMSAFLILFTLPDLGGSGGRKFSPSKDFDQLIKILALDHELPRDHRAVGECLDVGIAPNLVTHSGATSLIWLSTSGDIEEFAVQVHSDGSATGKIRIILKAPATRYYEEISSLNTR